jgi:hypothetical protein
MVEFLCLNGSNELLAIFSLIKSDNLQAIKLIVKDDSEIAGKNWDDATLFVYAAATGNETILQTLLAKIDLNATYDQGKMALMYAAKNGQQTIVQMLLAAKVHLDAVDANGETALMYAAKNDQRIIVQMLLAAGANRNAVDANEKMAIDHAALGGHLEMVQLLVPQHIERHMLSQSLGHIYRACQPQNNVPHPLAAKYLKIRSFLANVLQEPISSTPTKPPTQQKLTWEDLLPTKKSPNFETLRNAQTIEEICKALEEINQSLVACGREFSSSEKREFAKAMQKPIIQTHQQDPRIVDLLLRNVQIQQGFSSK